MGAPRDPSDPALAEAAKHAWLQFRTALSELRPELYRFCRSLSSSPWDAEDLVQETLMRAFVTLGSQYGQRVERPRAWLFRIATNCFIDERRRRREAPAEQLPETAAPFVEPQAEREAISTLIGRLSPQERVALVLKETFDASLEEIAEALDTSTGAVKAALHRGRSKLAASEPVVVQAPTPAAVTEFCEAFNAGDLERLTSLLLVTAVVELPGVASDWGVEATRDVDSGILYHALLTPLSSGVPARYLTDYVPSAPRAQLVSHRDEALALIWYEHRSGSAVRAFFRFDVDQASGSISRVRTYYYSPEALAEICGELALAQRSSGYGF